MAVLTEANPLSLMVAMHSASDGAPAATGASRPMDSRHARGVDLSRCLTSG